MSFVTLNPETAAAIKAVLTEKGLQCPLRIDLCFAGCCDPTLELVADPIREPDMTQEAEGITFAVSPDTYELTGEISIAYNDDGNQKGFILNSSRPVSEWSGFVVSQIRG